MTNPRVLVSIKLTSQGESRDGNPTLLRDTVLDAHTSVTLDGWSKANLLRSIAHRRNQTFCLFVLEVEKRLDALLVHLGTRERLALSEVLTEDAKRESPLSIFFLYCAPDVITTLREFVENYSSPGSFFVISSGDSHYFYFALACELTHWWQLASCRTETVTYEHLAVCVEKLTQAYLQTPDAGDCKAFVVLKPGISANSAWAGGHNYAPQVDIQTFRTGARSEQLDDTLKRMSDVANHCRGQHSAPEERMVSAQGLFWLSEASSPDQMAEWLRDSRLYRECHPYQSTTAAPILISERSDPDLSLFGILDSLFIHIPTGAYHFGSIDHDRESEPPAAQMDATVPGFFIMRRPVTYGFFRTFMQCEVSADMDAFPVVGLSYFEAERVAQVCSALNKKEGPAQWRRGVVRLPSEYQWEAAARGPDGQNYPWGMVFKAGCANFGMNIGSPTPVGQYSPEGDSPFGCEDMAGNVREWTRSYGGTQGVDWTMHTQRRIHGDESVVVESSRVVVKGGSYSYSSECLQSWVRNTQIASRRDKQTGFRLVMEV